MRLKLKVIGATLKHHDSILKYKMNILPKDMRCDDDWITPGEPTLFEGFKPVADVLQLKIIYEVVIPDDRCIQNVGLKVVSMANLYEDSMPDYLELFKRVFGLKIIGDNIDLKLLLGKEVTAEVCAKFDKDGNPVNFYIWSMLGAKMLPYKECRTITTGDKPVNNEKIIKRGLKLLKYIHEEKAIIYNISLLETLKDLPVGTIVHNYTRKSLFIKINSSSRDLFMGTKTLRIIKAKDILRIVRIGDPHRSFFFGGRVVLGINSSDRIFENMIKSLKGFVGELPSNRP